MSPSIPDQLDALALGESARIRGVRVTRRSLFGFQVGGAGELLPAPAAATRIAAAVKPAAPRIALCFRCAGDGLGRRDRGHCRVCHGRGIHVVEPPTGWSDASPAQLAGAVAQATQALDSTHHPRARLELQALLATLTRGTGGRGGWGGPSAPPIENEKRTNRQSASAA